MIKIYIQTDSKMLELRRKMTTAKRLLKRIAGEEEYEIILDSPDGLKKIKSRHRCRLEVARLKRQRNELEVRR